MVDDFWLRPVPDDDDDPATHPRLTDTRLAKTEAFLEVKLPEAYVALLRRLNGGVPRRDAYWLPDGGNHRLGSSIRFWCLLGVPAKIKRRVYTHMSIVAGRQNLGDYHIPHELVPSSHGISDHEYVCLDYRASGPEGPPSVGFLDTGGSTRATIGELIGKDHFKSTFIPLAPDFESFTEGLFYGTRHHIYGVSAPSGGEKKMVAALRRALDVRFTEVPQQQGTTRLFDNVPAYHKGQPRFEGARKDWRSAWAFRDEKDPARILVQMNAGYDGHLDFPQAPECEWTVWCDIQGRFRKKLERCFEGAALTIKPLHVPDVDRLRGA